MNKIYLGTNLKMFKGYNETIKYISEINMISQNISSSIQLFVIPSFLTINEAINLSKLDKCWIGSQNMSEKIEGALTGEVSPKQLQEVGVVINELGHSERRQLFGETDEKLAQKVKMSIDCKMKPLLCVGENFVEKDSGASISSVVRQLEIGLSQIEDNEIGQVLIAYEPVWAIGENGVPAEPKYVEKIHDAIRENLITMFGEIGKSVPLLYGGSVNLENYKNLVSIKNVNGLFIGRTAWDIRKFEEIILYIDKNKNKYLNV